VWGGRLLSSIDVCEWFRTWVRVCTKRMVVDVKRKIGVALSGVLGWALWGAKHVKIEGCLDELNVKTTVLVYRG